MTELRRVLRLPHATALVIGTIIGASIFVQPSEITGQVPTIGGVLLVWLLSGALTIVGALVCAELASTFTRTGGVYVYLTEAFHPSVGFLWGWAMFWSMHSGIIAVIAVVFARYAGFLVPLGDVGIRVVAVSVIVALSVVNYAGVQHGARLQTVFTAGKLLAILLIVTVGLVLGARLPDHFVGAQTPGSGVSMGSFLTAMVAGLFAFGGWHMVTYSAEETVDSARTIPRALVIGTMVVTGSYLAMNAVYLYVLPLDTVARSTRVAADLADALLGFGGGAVMSGIVMFSTFGALAGIVLAGPRVYYAMVQDGMVFRWIGAVHPRYRTPYRAIVLQAAWSSLLVLTGTYRVLFTRVVYTEWIFFALLALATVLVRRRTDVRRRYSAFGYPYLPILFALASFAIVANQIVTNTKESLVGLAFVAIGIPVYMLWGRRPVPGDRL